MEMISKLFITLQNKIKQFIKDHIIDKCPEEYDDIFQLMETIYIIGLAIALGGGFALGMYVTIQIGDWINRQIKKK